MKILIIGGGGREHAIAYALKKNPKVDDIHAIPGNPGMAKMCVCHPGDITDQEGILKYIEQHHIDYTVIGPEVPLCLGLVDTLESHGHRVFGPKKHAATLEGSKAFSKDFMARHKIPTADYQEVHSYEDAIQALSRFDYPVVIKADGLAAGKGVVICENQEDAHQTLREMMIEGSLDGAGHTVVLEEFLTGFECSLICFIDGKTIVPMVSAKDHKQIYDHNQGPNTGGMGAVSPNPFLPQDMDEIIKKDILDPFLAGVIADEMDYRGAIFIGLMIEGQTAKVIEFNVRFGDPEIQSIILRLESDLLTIMQAVSNQTLDQVTIDWNTQHTACLVLASGGYPGSYETGIEIQGLDETYDDIIIFHAGTTWSADGSIVTNGGRVLNICASGKSLEEARQKVYQVAEKIEFKGKYYRKDIGLI